MADILSRDIYSECWVSQHCMIGIRRAAPRAHQSDRHGLSRRRCDWPDARGHTHSQGQGASASRASPPGGAHGVLTDVAGFPDQSAWTWICNGGMLTGPGEFVITKSACDSTSPICRSPALLLVPERNFRCVQTHKATVAAAAAAVAVMLATNAMPDWREELGMERACDSFVPPAK